MSKTSKATEIGADAFRSNSVDGIGTVLGGLIALDYLGALITEWCSALAAGSDHGDLARLSDRQLADMGLRREDIPSEIHRRHYAG